MIDNRMRGHPSNPASKTMFTFEFIQNAFYTFNFLFLLMGLTILGIAIWMAAEFNFMVIILGHYYSVFVYMAIAAGGIIGIAAIIGCIGTLNLHKGILQVFLACLVFIILTLIVIFILAFVYRSKIGDSMRNEMTKSLVNDYGIKLNKRHNRRVTRAWDRLQEKFRCCAVDTNGWGGYRESLWYDEQIYTPDQRRMYVPRSCCVRDRFWRYIDRDTCQKWMVGPPGTLDSGSATNHVLYYKGCYDAIKDEFAEHAVIMGALVIVFAILMTLYLLCGIIMLRHLPNQQSKPAIRSYNMTEQSPYGGQQDKEFGPEGDEAGAYPAGDDRAYPSMPYRDDPAYAGDGERYAEQSADYPYEEKRPYYDDEYGPEYPQGASQSSYPVHSDNIGYSDA